MVYLDYSATTPVNDEVINTYVKVCKDFVGNPNSLHKLGLQSKKLIDASSKQIANVSLELLQSIMVGVSTLLLHN